MEFFWWGINICLGCLFGLEALHHVYLHNSLMHKRLHSGALIAFLAFSFISLAMLLYETLSGEAYDGLIQIMGALCTIGVLLQYVGYIILLKRLNLRERKHKTPSRL